MSPYRYHVRICVISDDEVWFYVEQSPPDHVERCIARRRPDDTFFPLNSRGEAILLSGPITLEAARQLEKLTERTSEMSR